MGMSHYILSRSNTFENFIHITQNLTKMGLDQRKIDKDSLLVWVSPVGFVMSMARLQNKPETSSICLAWKKTQHIFM